MSKKTVVIGMSGGVDSSVAAALLKEQGFNVVGLFMDNWNETDEQGVCTAADDFDDVKAVCAKIGIKCYSVSFAKRYYDEVFTYFLQSLKMGQTPNPDVLCNRKIKFGAFAEYAKTLGADFIATGHYAAVRNINGSVHLFKAADESKDQTYFLNQVATKQLENVIFPLCSTKKSEVRAIAARLGLVNKDKKDSTGICFIGERNFNRFLAQYLPAQSGKILDESGKQVGEHRGLMYYTIGQRRGLGIGGMKGRESSRWYVAAKDLQNNILHVANAENEPLYKSARASGVNIIGTLENACFDGAVKLRYRQNDVPARITIENDGIFAEFETPQRAVTRGQFLVVYQHYDGDSGFNRCVGGGELC